LEDDVVGTREIFMLILTRRAGERLMIGAHVTVKVLGIKRNQIRLGVSAPKNVSVHGRKTVKGSEKGETPQTV
jgi:carbon storage regulator